MMTHLNSTAKNNLSPYRHDKGYQPKNIKVLPLPPFGKEAALLLAYEKQPRNDIFLFAGLDGMSKAKAFEDTQIVLCLPYGTDPANYRWPVKYCNVLLFDTGFLSINDIDRIAYCLLSAKAEIVRALNQNQIISIYRRN